MTTKPRLVTAEKVRMLSLRMQGYTTREIGGDIGCSQNAVSYNLRKYDETEDFKEREHPGRPEKLEDREKRYLMRLVLQDPTITSSEVATQFNQSQPVEKYISSSYVRKFYQANGLEALVRPKKWYICPKNRRNRVKWAKEYESCPPEYWQDIVFSDESLVSKGAGRQYVRIRKEGKPTSSYGREISRHGVKVMVWGAISYDGHKVLAFIDEKVTGKVYKRVLQQNLLHNFPELGTDDLLFQHDGAPGHRAVLVKNYLSNKHVQTLPWPSQSPDINIIENVWAILKRGLKSYYPTKRELIEDIQRNWDDIDIHYIRALYDSIPNRLKAVIEAKGGPTKY